MVHLLLFIVFISSCYCDVILEAMKAELKRSFDELKMEGRERPYFISYSIVDYKLCTIKAKYGGIITSRIKHQRPYYIEVRVGDYEFDNMEPPSEMDWSFEHPEIPFIMPLTDDIEAIRHCLWLGTDFQYKMALRNLSMKKSKLIQKLKRSKSPSFSKESPIEFISEEKINLDLNKVKQEWERKTKTFSALFKQYSEIVDSCIYFCASIKNRYYVNTEGTIIYDNRVLFHLLIYAHTIADDGMKIWSYRDFYGFSDKELPAENEIKLIIDELAKEVLNLKRAPKMTPYSGPAIIKSPASCIFFHEVFGHRFEAHRQESEKEAETFKDKIGKKILPTFISIYSDPTLKYYNGSKPLIGHYKFDDEGIKAVRVTIVDKGILKNFLMSRMPIENFSNSNAHGRKEISTHINQIRAVPRQSNLIVESSKSVPFEKLKKLLIKECKKKRKPYGLIFSHSYSGATTTRRYWIQSFLQKPLVVYKLDIKTGKEELVRGIEFGGTPLVSADKIIAVGNDPMVFNGYCGAESGAVPVSAVVPSILLSEVEVQKSPESLIRPPILLPPWLEN